jgi:hypothetical protein
MWHQGHLQTPCEAQDLHEIIKKDQEVHPAPSDPCVKVHEEAETQRHQQQGPEMTQVLGLGA